MTISATPKFLALLCIMLGLSACAQTITTSHLSISENYLSDAIRRNLVDQVYQKAESLGGECKLLSAKRQYHTCAGQSGNPSFRFGVGYGPKGDYSVSVTSTLGHWVPPSKHAVTSGGYLTKLQKEFEQWMRSLVPENAIVRTTRTYSGYDHKEEF